MSLQEGTQVPPLGIGTTFKKRYNNHKRYFNLATYKNDTELSKEFWKTKR